MRAGEPTFERAVDATIMVLREVARRSRDEADALISYRGLSDHLAEKGLRIPYHGGPMPHVLEEASLREHAVGRAMVSALVVQQSGNGILGRPSAAFFRLARRPPFSRQGDDDQLWLTEVRNVRADNGPVAMADRQPWTGQRLVTPGNLGAWMIKCNPGVWDFGSFVDTGGSGIDVWSVVPSYRTAMMQEGQRILLWVTGRDNANPTPGLWGAGDVLGPVAPDNPEDLDGPGFWLNDDKRTQAGYFVPVDLQLFEEPLSRRALKADPRLASMEIFRQPQMGNPLFVTKNELAAIDDLMPSRLQRISVTSAGAGFGNPTSNAIVEQAAMTAVRRQYENTGWQVDDVSTEKCGWDLTCRSTDGHVDRVEVKGVSGLEPIILLTRNEQRSAREDNGWRLAVVTKALVAPQVHQYEAAVALRACAPFLYQLDLRAAALVSTPRSDLRAEPA